MYLRLLRDKQKTDEQLPRQLHLIWGLSTMQALGLLQDNIQPTISGNNKLTNKNEWHSKRLKTSSEMQPNYFSPGAE